MTNKSRMRPPKFKITAEETEGENHAFHEPGPGDSGEKIAIPAGRRRTPALVLSPNEAPVLATGVLWIHGGGYILGMKEMVHMSRAVDLVKKFGAVVVSPGYRLAFAAPYPAVLDDCHAALV